MGLTVSTRVELNFDEAQKRARRAAEAAVRRGAEALLKAANETVPVEDGDLKDSGRVQMGEEGMATISYGTEYAVRQHEDTGLQHDGSGRAKWLQLAAQERAREVGDETAEAFEEAF